MTGTAQLHGQLRCPDCDGEDFEAVEEAYEVNLRCLGCGALWHIELGYISRVNRHSRATRQQLPQHVGRPPKAR